jgi:DNA-binding NarL/FixJ family response regulator
MLNILVVDNHLVVRDGIKLILENEPDFHVADVAASGQQALEKMRAGLDISIVVTDWRMQKVSGLELIHQIRKDHKHIAIVVLSVIDDQKTIDEAFQSGINAYVSKVSDSSELILAIRRAIAGKTYICSYLTARMINKKPDETVAKSPIATSLTSREQEVLKMVASGLTNREIADKLFASRRTVEGYRQKLLTKTGTKNTATLIRFAIESNMVGWG